MDTASITLAQTVSALQLALQNTGRFGEIAPQLSQTVRTAGELADWNLPDLAVRTLASVRDGGIIHEEEALRSLALMAARVGAREIAAGNEGSRSLSPQTKPLDAVRALLATQYFANKKPPPDGFWARMKDPTDGFEPFLTASGTQVAFFDSPEALGEVWAPVVRGHWENGVGLVAFLNEKAGACGMIFVHGIGRAPWSRPDRNLWYSSGGSMAFPQEQLTFADALLRVVDKGVAMTLKWRAVDASLKRVGHKTPTGLGGSKGIFLHGRNGQGYAKGLDVYGEVIASLGMTLTGSDEGIGPDAADLLARRARYNIVGTKHAHYMGYAPIGHTADGVLSAIGTVHTKILRGRESPVLLVGYGGIGSLIHKALGANRLLPLSGVVDVVPSRLAELRGAHDALSLFQDASVMEPSTLESWNLKLKRIPSVPGLARIVEQAKGTAILSPNGGPHPIDFDVAAAMITAGVRAVAGSANNQAGVDAGGSPDAIAWILQAAGIFHAADFVVNKMGAAAVISNAVVLGFSQLRHMAQAVGENVEDEIENAYRRGVPPFIYERDRAANAWNQRIAGGEAKGGRFRENGR
jgi:hypothetical protein